MTGREDEREEPRNEPRRNAVEQCVGTDKAGWCARFAGSRWSPALPLNAVLCGAEWLAMSDSVTIEAIEENGPGAYYCTITTDHFEVNVDLRKDELQHFDHLESFDRDLRKSKRIGSVLGQPAWWCVSYEEGAAPMFTILLGEDDDVWKVCFVLSPGVIAMLREEAAACRK